MLLLLIVYLILYIGVYLHESIFALSLLLKTASFYLRNASLPVKPWKGVASRKTTTNLCEPIPPAQPGLVCVVVLGVAPLEIIIFIIIIIIIVVVVVFTDFCFVAVPIIVVLGATRK